MPVTSLGQVIPVLGPNLGFPGTVSRIPNPTIVSRPVNTGSTLNLNFGDGAVVISDTTGGTWKSVADFMTYGGGSAATALAAFAGFAVREVKTQLGYPPAYGGQQVGYYQPGELGEVLELGAILVTLQGGGTPQANQPVYMRVVSNPAISTVIGGVEAAADGVNTFAVPNCVFRTGDVDSNNLVEVIMLVRHAA